MIVTLLLMQVVGVATNKGTVPVGALAYRNNKMNPFFFSILPNNFQWLTLASYHSLLFMKKLLYYLLVLLFANTHKANAQDFREYKKYEIIELTNGLKVEILGNRGEGPSREVDVIYYTEKRQTGKRMWQLASVLYQEENAALISRGMKPLYKIPEPVKPKIDTLPVQPAQIETVIDNPKKIEAETEEETTPDLKPIREIKGPNPARKPLKEIDSIAIAVVEPPVISDSLSEEPIIAITYRVIIPNYDSGARHNYIIGLDSNNNPFLIDDTIAADFFSKPYDDLIPPEVIEAFKKDVIFPLPIYIPIEDKKTELPKPDIQKPEPPILPKKAAGKSL